MDNKLNIPFHHVPGHWNERKFKTPTVKYQIGKVVHYMYNYAVTWFGLGIVILILAEQVWMTWSKIPFMSCGFLFHWRKVFEINNFFWNLKKKKKYATSNVFLKQNTFFKLAKSLCEKVQENYI